MARLYADEDVPDGLTQLLRDLGHDVLTVAEAGRRAGSDTQVLADAITDQRAVVTFNRWDFKRLHRQNSMHAGIVSCSRDDDENALAIRIDQAIATAGTLAGRHLRVNRPP